MEDSFSAAGERLDDAALAAMAERLERMGASQHPEMCGQVSFVLPAD